MAEIKTLLGDKLTKFKESLQQYADSFAEVASDLGHDKADYEILAKSIKDVIAIVESDYPDKISRTQLYQIVKAYYIPVNSEGFNGYNPIEDAVSEVFEAMYENRNAVYEYPSKLVKLLEQARENMATFEVEGNIDSDGRLEQQQQASSQNK